MTLSEFTNMVKSIKSCAKVSDNVIYELYLALSQPRNIYLIKFNNDYLSIPPLQTLFLIFYKDNKYSIIEYPQSKQHIGAILAHLFLKVYNYTEKHDRVTCRIPNTTIKFTGSYFTK